MLTFIPFITTQYFGITKNMKKVTNDIDFYRLFTSSFFVESVDFQGHVKIDKVLTSLGDTNPRENLEANLMKGATIKNCIIQDMTIDLSEAYPLESFCFDNVQLGELRIKNIKVGKLEIKNCKINRLVIESGSFEDVCLSDVKDCQSLSINNGSFESLVIKDVQTADFKIKGGTFDRVLFTGYLLLGDHYSRNSLEIGHILEGTFRAFEFKNCTLTSMFQIDGGSFKDGIVFKETIRFIQYFRVVGGIFEKPIVTEGRDSHLRGLQSFDKLFRGIIIFHDCGGLNISGEGQSRVFIDFLTIEYLPKKTFLSEITVETLLIQNHDSEVEMTCTLNRISVNRLSIYNFNNHGRVTFNNLLPYTPSKFSERNRLAVSKEGKLEPMFQEKLVFSITNSNLGSFDFISCDLRIFKLYINSSKLINIFYTNTLFPKPEDIEVEEYGIENFKKIDLLKKTRKDNIDDPERYQPSYKEQESKINILSKINSLVSIFFPYSEFPQPHLMKKYRGASLQTSKFAPIPKIKKLRDVFEQLQTVATKQGDISQAVIWQAMAQKYYMMLLKYRKNKKWPYQFQEDWIVLFLNWISNDFRRSVSRGIVFTFLTGLTFYMSYITLIDKNFDVCFSGCNTWKSWNYAWNKYAYLFTEFMNPTHNADFMKDVKYVNEGGGYKVVASIVDFLSRIFVGYGIFQTIQAFRKFGKSGE